ncbi:hypothetical protein [Serratia marcescens]|uniref:hypothetical protein n=1 Tax=Serratia marcescens TaxID=615 RepID=UPI0012FDB79A|nr:hypothetical protein [Serratia marcescens]
MDDHPYSCTKVKISMFKQNLFQTKDDLFLRSLKNKRLAALPHPTKRVSHTYEFHNSILHDRNFNNIQKTIQESWASAVILRNAIVFGETIYKLSKLLEKIWLKTDHSEEFTFFVKKIEADVDRDGQFARVKKTGDCIHSIIL